ERDPRPLRPRVLRRRLHIDPFHTVLLRLDTDILAAYFYTCQFYSCKQSVPVQQKGRTCCPASAPASSGSSSSPHSRSSRSSTLVCSCGPSRTPPATSRRWEPRSSTRTPPRRTRTARSWHWV